jgi:hypothetical protein
MILFYNKKTGKVFATIDGRVHSEHNMKCEISDGTPKEDIGRMIIGWEEKKGKRIEHNIDKFEQLQKFENNDPKETPLNYKIEKNNLIKK